MKYYFMAFVPDDGDKWTVLLSPDFPEAASQGASVNECMEMAIDVLRITVEAYIEEGRQIPEPCDIETARQRTLAQLADLEWKPRGEIHYQLIPVIIPDTTVSSIRVKIPGAVLDEIDYKANLCGMNRSQFLVAAARAYQRTWTGRLITESVFCFCGLECCP